MQAAVTKQITNWETIRGAIAAKIDDACFSSWIAPLVGEISDDCLYLYSENQFSADYVSGVYGKMISDAAAAHGLTVRILVRSARRTVSVANDNRAGEYRPAADTAATNATSHMSAFDSFIASDENTFVLSACRRVAAGAVSFSPLFIYGPSGSGKTLLCECVRDASAGRVVMMTGATFVSEFTRSLTSHTIFAFKDFCRNCDTFILDNIDVIAGKRASMDEFLNLVLDLRDAGKNIILTSSVAPNGLAGFDRRAISLFASGLVADVVAPNTAVRRTMLRRAGLNADVIDAILPRVPADGHAICGITTKVRTYAQLMGVSVDLTVAEHLLADVLNHARTPIAMVHAMCERLGVSYDAVCGSGRCRSLVLARQIMMAVLKRATNLSLSEIGNMVGGRNHATVLYGISQIEKLSHTDLVLASQIEQMVNDL